MNEKNMGNLESLYSGCYCRYSMDYVADVHGASGPGHNQVNGGPFPKRKTSRRSPSRERLSLWGAFIQTSMDAEVRPSPMVSAPLLCVRSTLSFIHVPIGNVRLQDSLPCGRIARHQTEMLLCFWVENDHILQSSPTLKSVRSSKPVTPVCWAVSFVQGKSLRVSTDSERRQGAVLRSSPIPKPSSLSLREDLFVRVTRHNRDLHLIIANSFLVFLVEERWTQSRPSYPMRSPS